MASKIAWEAVAHFYKYVEHEVFVSHQGSDPIRRISPSGEDLSAYYQRSDLVASGFSVKPILRDLDDMTDAEIEEAHMVEWGEPIDIGDSPLQYRSRVEWLQGYDGHFSPALFAYLILRGFDVFRLIETGQAIRKEVSV